MPHNVAHPALRRQTLSDLLHREFDTVVSRLAAGLHAQGVAQGEHVGVLARNSHGFAALRFALARLGRCSCRSTSC
jgi:fatty-acyl-CoA synthase